MQNSPINSSSGKASSASYIPNPRLATPEANEFAARCMALLDERPGRKVAGYPGVK